MGLDVGWILLQGQAAWRRTMGLYGTVGLAPGLWQFPAARHADEGVQWQACGVVVMLVNMFVLLTRPPCLLCPQLASCQPQGASFLNMCMRVVLPLCLSAVHP